VTDDGEECDDGANNSDTAPDACRSDCTVPTCGDGVTDSVEECDNGANNSDSDPDACRTSCLYPSCGDGITDAGELCDDGDANSDLTPDTCRTSCVLPRCGDWVLDVGEECDGGTNNSDTNPGACRTDCHAASCGDGVTDEREECDAGTANSDTDPDACRVACVFATCGDGVTDAGELCDDGASNSDTAPDACRTSCVPPTCGDDVWDTGEGCDDGNDATLDGCDPSCAVEFGWICSGTPSSCSVDCQDADGDMYGGGSGCLGTDCDETNPDVHAGATEVCNDIDDNCDGNTDENLDLVCYSGSANTVGVGACVEGVSSCVGGTYSPCMGEIAPVREICGDGVDNDCDGEADQVAACPNGLGTFVSKLTGDDNSGDGTQQNPVATIAKGMANAVTMGGGQAVYVAEGTYSEQVNLIDGISLLGGFQCDASTCTWTRDPVAYVSTIANTHRQGVYADVYVTSSTVLEGFTITGINISSDGSSQTPGTSAVTVAGGTPVVRGNIIRAGVEGFCGSANACGSFGVRVVGPTNDPAEGVTLEGNAIYGGTSANQSCPALALARNPAPIVSVVGNWIKGGTCRYNRAVDAWFSGYGTEFLHNEIFAGTSSGSGGTSFAIVLSGYSVLDGNMINHDPSEVGTCRAPSDKT
jgi:cysteine-rich repeat protein